MHAFLIVGKTEQDRLEEIAKRIKGYAISSWDTIALTDAPTIGIDEIREFERALRLSPRASGAKAGVLTHIERLTVPAQNALLKTLEEPPPHTYLLAETATPLSLLPTILSRFALIRLGADVSSQPSDTITATLVTQLWTASAGKRLHIVDTLLTSVEEPTACVSSLIAVTRQMLLDDYNHPNVTRIPPQKLAHFLRVLLAAQSQLSVNVNPRLTIDNAVLQFV